MYSFAHPPPPQKKGVVWISNYKSHTYKSADLYSVTVGHKILVCTSMRSPKQKHEK